MKDIYLTIDDSPSPYTDKLVDFLDEHGIAGTFYVRGALVDENPEPLIRALKHGHIVGNHLYSHQRASILPFKKIVDEIEKTEHLIEYLYRQAGSSQKYKLLRFPHMDRGCGAQIVDYEAYPKYKKQLESIFLDSLNVKPAEPDKNMIEKKGNLQAYLLSKGYEQPFKGITHGFFRHTEMVEAYDSMFTYSTGDWMLTKRHLGKWPYKSVNDLVTKMDRTLYLKDEKSADILLIHDDRQDILDVTKKLLEYWIDKKANFLRL